MNRIDPRASNRTGMSFATEFSLLLIFASLFSQNNGAFFKKIDKPVFEDFSQHYSRMRKNNVHRGILLSKPVEKQNILCDDILSALYFKKKHIVLADEDLGMQRDSSDESYDTMVTKKMTSEGRVVAEAELFLICHGREEGLDEPQEAIPFYISSAFQASAFHVSENTKRNNEVEVEQYYEGSTAPKDLNLDLYDLEELYIKTHQNIEILRQESPEYVEMIKARDDIQALSSDERIELCASILSTYDFRSQKLVLDMEWAGGSEEVDILNDQPLRIWNEDYPDYKISSDNILCRAYNTVFKNKKDFYYTSSFNDKNSVFFIDKHDSHIDHELLLDFNSYFENIPVLMNAKKSDANRTVRIV